MMKPAVLAISLFATIALASRSAEGRPRWGLEAGIHHSTFDYIDPLDIWKEGWRTSPTAGATIEFPLDRHWSLLGGLHYQQNGTQVDFDTGPPPGATTHWKGRFEVTQHVLSIPFLLKLRLIGKPGPFLCLGAETAWSISASVSTKEVVTTDSRDFDFAFVEPVSELFDPLAWSADAGAGFDFGVGAHAVSLQARFSRAVFPGMRSGLAWTEGPPFATRSDWKTMGVEALVGIEW